MSVCFHPHLFDSERFLAEEGGCESTDEKAMLLVDCFTEEVDFGWSLDGTEETDLIAGRIHPETKDYLGGMVDAVRAGLPGKRSKASKLLARASCLEGPLSETEPAFGYLTREEVSALASELEGVGLRVRGLEADRVLLLRLLAVAHEHGRGLAFMAM